MVKFVNLPRAYSNCILLGACGATGRFLRLRKHCCAKNILPVGVKRVQKQNLRLGVSMKILIIGYSGSGKSTLAQRLGETLNLPVLHLDSVHFFGNWQERTVEEQTELVRRFLAQNSCWIIDGNYSSVATERFERSDVTVFLKLNRFSCFFAAWKRYKQHKGRCRADLPCEEKFDKEFRRWVLWKGRTKEREQKLQGLLEKTQGKKVVLKNRRQINKFVEEMQSVAPQQNHHNAE